MQKVAPPPMRLLAEDVLFSGLAGHHTASKTYVQESLPMHIFFFYQIVGLSANDHGSVCVLCRIEYKQRYAGTSPCEPSLTWIFLYMFRMAFSVEKPQNRLKMGNVFFQPWRLLRYLAIRWVTPCQVCVSREEICIRLGRGQNARPQG